MTQSIELLLDDDLDAAVRAEWEALKQAGLSSQARHTSPNNSPHVTLAVASQIPDAVDTGLADLAGGLPLPLRLGSLLCFAGHQPGRFYLVRMVVPSVDLLLLQGRAAQHVRGLPGTGQHLEPGAWSPHVTLAHNVPAEHVSVALAVLADLSDLEGEAVAVRRWDSVARRTWLLG